MTRLSFLTLRRFIRPLVGSLVIISAFVLLFAYSRTAVPTTKAQADDTPTTESVTATFPADAGSLGAIPDGTALTPLPAFGAAKNVTFQSNLAGNVQTVEVSFTSGGPSHTFRGDIEAILIAPGGASHLLFSRTGATTSGSFGSGSDLTGPYNFTDTATGSHWWAVTANPTTPGNYRTVGPGFSATNPPVTTMNTAFAGTPATGTWTLRFRDGASADTGSISAASLTITSGGGTPIQHVVDFNGDGKTDYAVIRNTGGGPTGQTTWFINNGVTAPTGSAWGITTDFFIPEDYDGDGKTDIAVWRSGAPTVAAFYILQSSTNTFRLELFGQTGDDPSVVGDYDNDNKADVAVYRPGLTPGAQSTWYYRGSNNNPNGNTTFVPFGVNGDFPVPGDFDGDGSNDFVVQRDAGGGQAVFWQRLATGAVSTIFFGLSGDSVVPGDYDGDGKTDIAVARANGTALDWYIRQSSNGAMVGGPFGLSATDFFAQGDYDGDGKTDIAVWRPSAAASDSRFWYLSSMNGAAVNFQWGASGDYPAANYNSH